MAPHLQIQKQSEAGSDRLPLKKQLGSRKANFKLENQLNSPKRAKAPVALPDNPLLNKQVSEPMAVKVLVGGLERVSKAERSRSRQERLNIIRQRSTSTDVHP